MGERGPLKFPQDDNPTKMRIVLTLIAILRAGLKLGPWQAFKLLFLASRQRKLFSIRGRTRLSIRNDKAAKYALSVVEYEDTGTSNAYSIGTIMDEKGWDSIDVLKLDVEGSEVPILQDSHRWIDRIDTLIIEIHQDIAPDSAQVLFRAFADQDFHLMWRGENLVLSRHRKETV